MWDACVLYPESFEVSPRMGPCIPYEREMRKVGTSFALSRYRKKITKIFFVAKFKI